MSGEASTQSQQQAPASLDPAWAQYLAWLFAYHELHVRQRVLTLSQKYVVSDAYDVPRFFVVRPPKLAANVALGLVITVIRFAMLFALVQYMAAGNNPVPGVVAFAVASFALGLAHVLMAPYRQINVYTDESEAVHLLTITQDNKIGLERRYTLYDMTGAKVAVFRRDTLRSVIRRDWVVEAPSGDALFRVREDSWVLALMRRYLGPMWGLLRTNFNFEFSDGRVFGTYDRKMTVTDQYRLNVAGDPQFWADRRAVLAMGILLDTGEAR